MATLPLLLRTILGVRGKERVRTILVLNPANFATIRDGLLATGRVPPDVEWLAVDAETALPKLVRTAGLNGGRIAFISAGCAYRPSLLRALHDWDGDGGALDYVISGKPVGLYALAPEMAARLAAEHESKCVTIETLHEWISKNSNIGSTSECPCREIDQDSWQAITRPQDCLAAERKLDCWLVKPTDGVFARMNRRVSIPISHQLIKFPISPNMVSLFTLTRASRPVFVSRQADTGTALPGRWSAC